MFFGIIVLLSLIVFLTILGFITVSIIQKDLETLIKLLVPMGVLLSAGLASISVMKSILNIQEIENNKEQKINNKLNFHINRLYSLNLLIQKEILNKNDYKRLYIYKNLLEKELNNCLKNDDMLYNIKANDLDNLINGIEILTNSISNHEKLAVKPNGIKEEDIQYIQKTNKGILTLLDMIFVEPKLEVLQKNKSLKKRIKEEINL
ncbi:hypothetical protein CRV02_04340 [Arcobacter sp. CECT 8989]|uniref:hypothetical protein n=1 Tax=Arcobacter sp. CECT 8989 TaxID=2044509 RepID=UPI00100BB3E8|nr:hypothetical protein [Arcobacter sp. CECT 8989]RXK02671.1 hypothetical protein CRV02_04340 [Arcobacter sp. CECT 8989]